MRKSSKCKYTIGGVVKDKVKYLRPEEAMRVAKLINEKDASKIHVMVAYKCTTCFFFHIGRSHEIKPSLLPKI